ncbi:MAG: DUF1800 domain-containing protein [Deltaproteobacteria bacterium]|nr:DUF1800 domain-containing protein [Deltaproteobacteria bacterium]
MAQIGFEGALHLLGRIGIGPRPDELARFAALDRDAAIATVVAELDGDDDGVPAAARPSVPPEGAGRREAIRLTTRATRRTLPIWQVERWLGTDQPAREGLIRFWHNHFTTHIGQIHWAPWLYQQDDLFRREALHFDRLLAGVLRDPAMLVYLDQVHSHRRRPNENLARELLELFTLGHGHYGESDVRELARALTGASMDRPSFRYLYRPLFHDPGVKQILGRSGRFGPDEVAPLLLEQPQTARHVASRLYRWLVGAEAPLAEQEALGAVFRATWRTDLLIAEILARPAFWASRGGRIRTPVDLVVGTLRTAGVRSLDQRAMGRLQRALQALGEAPFNPPSVEGFPEGPAWIDTLRLRRRHDVLAGIIGNIALRGRRGRVAAVVLDAAFDQAMAAVPGATRREKLCAIALVTPPVTPLPDGAGPGGTLQLLRALLDEPALQLG